MYFHDKGTNRRVMLIGLMFCTAFVLVSFFARPQPENDRVLVKADRLTLTAGKPPSRWRAESGKKVDRNRPRRFTLAGLRCEGTKSCLSRLF